MYARVAALSVVFALFAGCSSDTSHEMELEGRTFLLESSQGFEGVAGTTVRLSFRKGELGFSAGCNSHSGMFAVRDDRLVMDSLGSTQIGCEAALQAQDEWLAEFMTARPTLELEDTRLTLSNPESTLVFLDREIADPDRPLAGTLWTLDTFIDAGAASNVPLSSPPTLRFDADGSVSVDTSCNTGAGRYSVLQDQVTLVDVVFSKQACSGTSAFADTSIRAVIADGTVSFRIEAARLTLMRGSAGLGAVAP